MEHTRSQNNLQQYQQNMMRQLHNQTLENPGQGRQQSGDNQPIPYASSVVQHYNQADSGRGQQQGMQHNTGQHAAQQGMQHNSSQHYTSHVHPAEGQHRQALMSDEDMAGTILADLKRVSREYATAVTEAACPDIRRGFNDLLASTLQLQGKLYELMRDQHMYSTPSPAVRHEIANKLQNHRNNAGQTEHYLRQLGLLGGVSHAIQPFAVTEANDGRRPGAEGSYQPVYM
ncbi:spore coat protein [Paenibacillus tarimensis]|uniref:spore coat protein n=1 Tax=Paenibacillus tarimensis TaxID=416012 RepID=UPI001F38851A|nr:spore coat protein [Paenibacillus tarimensis]MCF2942937.1 spore coat protein [Paenibacillus tarimensis]